MQLSGKAKAAVFLLSLPEEKALKVIEQLDERELRELKGAVEGMNPIPQSALQEVYSEFTEDFKRGLTSVQGGSIYLRSLVTKVRGEQETQRIFTERALAAASTPGEPVRPFAALADADPEVLRVALAEEHPQVAAAVLGHLTPTLAAQIIQKLPTGQQTDVVLRLALLSAIPPEALADAEFGLGGLGFTAAASGGDVNGLESAASILNELPGNTANELIERIAENHPDQASQLQRAMFSFEHLIEADARGLQQLLREVQSDTLLVALKTASQTLKEKLLSCMSSRAAAMLQEELELMPPVRLVDVENAQQQIISTAMRLLNEGKLSIKGRGEELL
jgi:flagellar motor switch protein FliG